MRAMLAPAPAATAGALPSSWPARGPATAGLTLPRRGM